MSRPGAAAPLRLRGRELAGPVVMAIVNRTADSFYAPARHADDGAALAAVERAVAEGADLVDVGGVRAGRGPEVDVDEEIRRVVPFLAAVRARHPDLLLSVDTWRAPVARAAAAEGVDLINDTWAGADPGLLDVAAEAGLGVVCSHTGGAAPRTDPLRVEYPAPDDAADPRDGVLADVLATLRAGAARAVERGIDPASVIVDATLDFGKNSWQSLHLLRHTDALAALGHPVLVAASRKDVVGEVLDLPPGERLEGSLAATAVAVWLGARIVRAHDVRATRRALDMVAALRDELPPRRAVRGLT